MFKNIHKRFRDFSITFLFSGWWLDCKIWWLSRDRDYFPLILLGGLGVIIGVSSIMLIKINTQQADNRQLTCLALNIYHEARGEPDAGQFAVAKVTLNRVASRRYPNTICDVVYQKKWDRIRRRYVGAFSWTEFDIKPSIKNQEWQQALRVAEAALNQDQLPELKGVLFYHARSIKPSWARNKKPIAHIGRHVFYR
ncbi:MAG: cell wall hydrolase [Thiohalomonadales bacterium]|nr:cell wall hydrolase [Thiohalomonadales bacterium]